MSASLASAGRLKRIVIDADVDNSTVPSAKRSKPSYNPTEVDTSTMKKVKPRLVLLMRSMMNREKSTSPFPLPPSQALISKVEGLFPLDDDLPTSSAPKLIDLPSTMVKYPSEFPSPLYQFIEETFQRHAVTSINFNFAGHLEDRYNQIMIHIIIVVVCHAITVGHLAKKARLTQPTEAVLRASIRTHFQTLQSRYSGLQRNPDYISDRMQTAVIGRNQRERAAEYRSLLQSLGAPRRVVAVFLDPQVMGEERGQGAENQVWGPRWWSDKMRWLMRYIESVFWDERSLLKKVGPRRPQRLYSPLFVVQGKVNVPLHMPLDLVDESFLNSLLSTRREMLKVTSPLLPDSDVAAILRDQADLSNTYENLSLAEDEGEITAAAGEAEATAPTGDSGVELPADDVDETMENVGAPASSLLTSHATSEAVMRMDEERHAIDSRVIQRLGSSSGRSGAEKAPVRGNWEPLSGRSHLVEDRERTGVEWPGAGSFGCFSHAQDQSFREIISISDGSETSQDTQMDDVPI